MLITKKWSNPKPLEFGKNILIKSSHGNFSYRISAATGESVEGIITERSYLLSCDDELIRLIQFPMISFRANTNDELHVHFEYL